MSSSTSTFHNIDSDDSLQTLHTRSDVKIPITISVYGLFRLSPAPADELLYHFAFRPGGTVLDVFYWLRRFIPEGSWRSEVPYQWIARDCCGCDFELRWLDHMNPDDELVLLSSAGQNHKVTTLKSEYARYPELLRPYLQFVDASSRGDSQPATTAQTAVISMPDSPQFVQKETEATDPSCSSAERKPTRRSIRSSILSRKRAERVRKEKRLRAPGRGSKHGCGGAVTHHGAGASHKRKPALHVPREFAEVEADLHPFTRRNKKKEKYATARRARNAERAAHYNNILAGRWTSRLKQLDFEVCHGIVISALVHTRAFDHIRCLPSWLSFDALTTEGEATLLRFVRQCRKQIESMHSADPDCAMEVLRELSKRMLTGPLKDVEDFASRVNFLYVNDSTPSRYAVDPALLSLRILLIIAGVEQNPGPCPSVAEINTQSRKQPNNKQRRQRKQRRGSWAHVPSFSDQVRDLQDRERAARDALDEFKQEADLRDQENRGRISELQKVASDNKKMLDWLESKGLYDEDTLKYVLARESDASFDSEITPYDHHYTFRGKFRGFNSTYLDVDPWCHVYTCDNSPKWYVTIPECSITVIYVTHSMKLAAAMSGVCGETTARFRNICGRFHIDNDVQKDVAARTDYYALTLTVIAFVLAAINQEVVRCRYANDFDEGIPDPYVVDPPPDWPNHLRGSKVVMGNDHMSVIARYSRRIRRCPFYLTQIAPNIPLLGSPSNLLAALCKRLYPCLPSRPCVVTAALLEKSKELVQCIKDNLAAEEMLPGYRVPTRDELFDHCTADRNSAAREALMRGALAYKTSQRDTVEAYCATPYKAMYKLEPYTELKPPRFIMMLPLEMRGVQMWAMCRILWKVEHGTRICNVKGLTVDEITQKLKDKFTECTLCLETDFSSFESCITPELKEVVENYIFEELAEPEDMMFINKALKRKFVSVSGDNWGCCQFHHIRMSGDYWTSLGNLLSNIVIMSYVLDMKVADLMQKAIFEGDDAVAPFPKDWTSAQLEKRADEAGVLLKFAVAPWESLSFCGNHFDQFNGQHFRSRDPLRTVMSLMTNFGCDTTTTADDMTLQRSKSISTLSQPWIRGASVFACMVEYLSRSCKVSKAFLVKHDLLKEFSPYALEECLPQWIRDCHDDDTFVDCVYDHDKASGGLLSKQQIRNALIELRETGCTSVELVPAPMNNRPWMERSGLRSVKMDGTPFYHFVDNYNGLSNHGWDPRTWIFGSGPIEGYKGQRVDNPNPARLSLLVKMIVSLVFLTLTYLYWGLEWLPLATKTYPSPVAVGTQTVTEWIIQWMLHWAQIVYVSIVAVAVYGSQWFTHVWHIYKPILFCVAGVVLAFKGRRLLFRILRPHVYLRRPWLQRVFERFLGRIFPARRQRRFVPRRTEGWSQLPAGYSCFPAHSFVDSVVVDDTDDGAPVTIIARSPDSSSDDDSSSDESDEELTEEGTSRLPCTTTGVVLHDVHPEDHVQAQHSSTGAAVPSAPPLPVEEDEAPDDAADDDDDQQSAPEPSAEAVPEVEPPIEVTVVVGDDPSAAPPSNAQDGERSQVQPEAEPQAPSVRKKLTIVRPGQSTPPQMRSRKGKKPCAKGRRARFPPRRSEGSF